MLFLFQHSLYRVHIRLWKQSWKCLKFTGNIGMESPGIEKE